MHWTKNGGLTGGLFLASLAGLCLSAEVRQTTPAPLEIVLGDVRFPHELHAVALELECEACHHETNAAKLVFPHESYFDDFWIDCKICHRDTPAAARPQSCSKCHHESPADIADETLSAKVVIHRSCWTCHEVGTGPAASRSCKTCHTQPKE